MLSKEQTEQIKKQVFQQIDSTFPEEQKESAKEQINDMNEEEFEEFLIKNNLIKSGEENTLEQRCILCEIIEEKIHSYKIDENKESIAVLEINPISKGHTLIIQKKHFLTSDKLPKTSFSLAKKISKKIKSKYKPKNITIVSSNLFGHEILNILPVYNNENLNSERKKITKEELEEIQENLKIRTRKKTVKKPKIKKIIEEKLWLPKRIP